jgi:hypothetical protein
MKGGCGPMLNFLRRSIVPFWLWVIRPRQEILTNLGFQVSHLVLLNLLPAVTILVVKLGTSQGRADTTTGLCLFFNIGVRSVMETQADRTTEAVDPTTGRSLRSLSWGESVGSLGTSNSSTKPRESV